MWIQHEHISMAILETASDPGACRLMAILWRIARWSIFRTGGGGASVNPLDDREQG